MYRPEEEPPDYRSTPYPGLPPSESDHLFLPITIIANQKDPYLHHIQLDKMYPRSVPTYTDKTLIRTEKPVLQNTQVNKSRDIQSLYDYTFTAKPTDKPVNIEPVSKTGNIQPEPDLKIPAFMLTSMEINESEFNKNKNIDKLLSNVRPNQITKIQVPIITDEQINLPKVNPLFVGTEQIYQKWLPTIIKKTALYQTNKNNSLLPYLPPVTGLPLPKLKEIDLPKKYDSYKNKFLPISEKLVPSPMLPRKPINNDEEKERLLKDKLVALLLSSKTDLQEQERDLGYIHDTLKLEVMYKIGYLTSHIKTMNNKISRLHKSVQNNQQNWDSLRILEIYEEVKSNYDKIRKLLKGMQSYLRARKKSGSQLGPREEKNPYVSDISWTYYDDTMN